MNKIIEKSIENFYNKNKIRTNDFDNIPYYTKEKLEIIINDRTSFINFKIGSPALEDDIINLIELAQKNTNINIEYYIITNDIKDNPDISNKFIIYNDGKLKVLRDLICKKNLYLQQEYSQASFVIIFTCDLHKTIVHDDVTYEQVLQEIGTISQLIWLEAVNKGLYGSVFAGTLQKELRNISNINYINRHQIFAIGLSRKGVKL